ncbi:histidine kinase [Treponema sp. J25]|uniref:sensor histidine kinase n=1 Tax=Treponema sp. J25 TaxID=2094121 RepID=UPI00104A00FC|nr:histidine kinase [Treponema sp. J25]TCW61469.1 hypothetical protein C5O22_06525 [Treponema sp. J25]
MHFQSRLLITYSLFVVFLIMGIALAFYSYSTHLYEQNGISTYALMAEKMNLQLDDTVRPMDFISTDILSDSDFKSALSSLEAIDREKVENNIFIAEAIRTIRNTIMRYSILRHFYGVVVFNQRGDFFSSNFLQHTQSSIDPARLEKIEWLREAQIAGGRGIIWRPYEDPWGKNVSERVFSFVRAIPGTEGEAGFLEVQRSYADLERIFSLPDTRYASVLALLPAGTIFYQSQDILSVDWYRNVISHEYDRPSFLENPVTHEEELVLHHRSSYTGITVIVILNKRLFLQPLLGLRWMIGGLAFILVLIAFVFNYISSRRLTEPLRLIISRIEETDLGSLPETSKKAPINHSHDEIIALDRAFRELTARLDGALQKEIESRTAWIQAQMDALQAQINPHFIYNLLTVIASKGLEVGSRDIVAICESLAGMLRYATDTQERIVTLLQEVDHVSNYLYLMKQRYEKNLEFSIQIEPAVEQVQLPRMSLQQFVENALNHGFQKVQRVRHVSVKAYQKVYQGEPYWCVEIQDNGQGIDQDTLQNIDEKIASIRQTVDFQGISQGQRIGSMGIINTYVRLYLYFGNYLMWRIMSEPDKGCCVTIGGPLEYGKKV